MSIDEFYKTPEWHRLSVQQKFFVQSYLASGNDRLFATHCAYNAEGESARTVSYHIMRQKKIQAALNRYWNRSLRDIEIQELEADIKASKPGSLARAAFKEMLAQVQAGGKLPKRSKKS
jgi:hypothetical protein